MVELVLYLCRYWVSIKNEQRKFSAPQSSDTELAILEFLDKCNCQLPPDGAWLDEMYITVDDGMLDVRWTCNVAKDFRPIWAWEVKRLFPEYRQALQGLVSELSRLAD